MDFGWTKYITLIEAANELACVETAKKSGHTLEEAGGCDSGSLGCSGCPFRQAA